MQDVKATFINVIRQWNYDFYQKYFAALGLICASLHLTFYFVLKNLIGYEESLLARGGAAVLFLFFIALPKEQTLTTWQKSYIEFTYIIVLPVVFSYLLLINSGNIYWFSSMIFCGLTYGLLSHQIIGLISYPIATLTVSLLYFRFNPSQVEHSQIVFLAHFVSFTMFLLSALVRTFFQLSFSANTELKVEKAKKEQIERNFRHLKSREEVIKRYVRPSLLAEVAMGLDPSHYKPKIIDTNVLFVDMRDFTSLSETLSLDECYSLLNEYFTIINQSIFKHHGEVDKIMGDAVMAVFNDPKECLNACIDMRHSLSQENKKRILGGKLPIRFGTGISSGKVLSANFGSNYKFDRTIVGDIVNIGARLEHLTKEYDLDVLATSDFIEQNPTFLEWRLIDTVYVQGKSFPVKAIEIFRHNSQAVIDYKISTKNDIAAILIHKLDGQFDRAIAGLNTLIDNCPRHSFHPNEIMDSYLIKLREKIMAEKIMAEKINTKRMAS